VNTDRSGGKPAINRLSYGMANMPCKPQYMAASYFSSEKTRENFSSFFLQN
jgi:hypothetical protein